MQKYGGYEEMVLEEAEEGIIQAEEFVVCIEELQVEEALLATSSCEFCDF